MINKKKTLLFISDAIISASGVANQTRFIAEHLLKTGKFRIISISVALQHPDMRPGKTQEWGDDLLIIPALRYDDVDLIRQILDVEKPDAMWIMTDPRFYRGLFQISHEVRKFCPILYNSIWDNADELTYPRYNKPLYDCIDYFGCINKAMFNTMKFLGIDQNRYDYIPHGVPADQFKILDVPQSTLRDKHFFGEQYKDIEFVIFYNSRNALRKRTGNVVMAYKTFRDALPEEEKKKVFLCMHTPPKDPEGQDLYRLIDDFGLAGTIGISGKGVSSETLCEYYNLADATLIMSSEEGFGLSCLESLMCGTPVVAGKTGGLQDQLFDEETGNTFGFIMEPDATSLIGSQEVPYIYSHHFSYEQAAKHLKMLWEEKKTLGAKQYKEKWAGKEARDSMMRRFNLEDVCKKWERIIDQEIEKFNQNKQNRKIEIHSL